MERKLIGQVSVDSGQLMIIDPCYIESHWKKDIESHIQGVAFWGVGKVNATTFLQSKGYVVHQDDDDGCRVVATKEQEVSAIQELLVDFLKTDSGVIIFSTLNNGSYQKVSKLTNSEASIGQLNGTIALAFQSGFGDGLYDVYATFKDCGFRDMEDIRISKVEIILIEE